MTEDVSADDKEEVNLMHTVTRTERRDGGRGIERSLRAEEVRKDVSLFAYFLALCCVCVRPNFQLTKAPYLVFLGSFLSVYRLFSFVVGCETSGSTLRE